jgi:hypothetical protein
MNPSPTGDQETPIAPSGIGPQSINAPTGLEQENPSSDRGKFTFVASLLLIAIAFCVGLSYLLEKRWLGERVTQIQTTAPADTIAHATAPLDADLFQVTEITLGSPRRATINGKRLTEGESLSVQTSVGLTSVRVARIENSAVELTDGTHTIEANAGPNVAQQSTP